MKFLFNIFMQETIDFDNEMYISWLGLSHGFMRLLIPQVLKIGIYTTAGLQLSYRNKYLKFYTSSGE